MDAVKGTVAQQLSEHLVGLDYRRFPATDGRVLEKDEVYEEGHSKNPRTAAELADKVRRLASSVVSPERSEKIMNTLSRLNELEDIAQLTSLMM